MVWAHDHAVVLVWLCVVCPLIALTVALVD